MYEHVIVCVSMFLSPTTDLPIKGLGEPVCLLGWHGFIVFFATCSSTVLEQLHARVRCSWQAVSAIRNRACLIALAAH